MIAEPGNALSNSESEQIRVFFVAYGSAHIAKVGPVVRELERRGVDCVVMALTVGYGQALRLGLRPVGYRDFIHLVDDPKRAIEIGKTLIDGNSHPDVDPDESAAYLGVNYLEWVDLYGEYAAERLYSEGGRRAFKPVNFMKRVLTYLKPHAVVSTSSPRSEQAAIEAAVECGIPSLTMMDSFALPAEPYHAHRVRADRVTVLSDVVKDNLIAKGMNAQRIRVTGCPGFDRHFSLEWDVAAKVFRKQMGWEGCSVILWAGGLEETPGTPSELAGARMALAVEQVLRLHVERRSGSALIVRYHPSQYHLFSPATNQARVYVSNPVEEPIELMVRVADTVVVQASTVGLEAAMVGKRVLALTYSPAVIWTGLNYAELAGAEVVGSLAELMPTLSLVPRASKARAPFAYRDPAAPRVADNILELISSARH